MTDDDFFGDRPRPGVPARRRVRADPRRPRHSPPRRAGPTFSTSPLDGQGSPSSTPIEQDLEGGIHLAVVVDDDPGKGPRRTETARPTAFFFRPDEVEPLGGRRTGGSDWRASSSPGSATSSSANDAFGCEAARRAGGTAAAGGGWRVVDFGIRGFDLAYALLDGYDGAILLERRATRRSARERSTSLETDPRRRVRFPRAVGRPTPWTPATVLRLVRALGGEPCRWLRVGRLRAGELRLGKRSANGIESAGAGRRWRGRSFSSKHSSGRWLAKPRQPPGLIRDPPRRFPKRRNSPCRRARSRLRSRKGPGVLPGFARAARPAVRRHHGDTGNVSGTGEMRKHVRR